MEKLRSGTVFFIVLLVLSSCLTNGESAKDTKLDLPNIKVVSDLPQFTSKANEIMISESFNDVDPSWVLGALVNLETGDVMSMDSYLYQEASSTRINKAEIIYKQFIEKTISANAGYLDFVTANLNSNSKAEVIVIKSTITNLDAGGIDLEQLKEDTKKIPISKRDKYGIIISYTDYIITASYFNNDSTETGISGYGARIGGAWYSKQEDINVQHNIVATISPLPFVFENLAENPVVDLLIITDEAINNKLLKMPNIKDLTTQRMKY